MNRIKSIKKIRKKLSHESFSIGSWMQIPNSNVAEIMGSGNFDWVAIDQEHGCFSNHQLPDIFRALEMRDTLPLVRLKDDSKSSCKDALDAGAGGVIVPMIESSKAIENLIDNCCWPPSGKRGVGFSRANLFGENFSDYSLEAQSPLIVGMIETKMGINNLDEILSVNNLDAVMLGPYDLSASLGITGDFKNNLFIDTLKLFLDKSKKFKKPAGIHIVNPDVKELRKNINLGYQFIAYSIDSVFLNKSIKFEI